jgi:hypothetical protein
MCASSLDRAVCGGSGFTPVEEDPLQDSRLRTQVRTHGPVRALIARPGQRSRLPGEPPGRSILGPDPTSALHAIVGPAWAEAKILRIAHAYEVATSMICNRRPTAIA